MPLPAWLLMWSLGLAIFFTLKGLLLWRFPPGLYRSRTLAPVTGLASIPVIWNIDCLPNAMENTVFFVIIGGLNTYLMSSEVRNWKKVPRRRASPLAEREPEPPVRDTRPGGSRPAGVPGMPGLQPARSRG